MDICFSYFYNVLSPDILVNPGRRRYCFLNTVVTRAPLGLNSSHMVLIAASHRYSSFAVIPLHVLFSLPGVFPLKPSLSLLTDFTCSHHTPYFHLPNTNHTIMQWSSESGPRAASASLDIVRNADFRRPPTKPLESETLV